MFKKIIRDVVLVSFIFGLIGFNKISSIKTSDSLIKYAIEINKGRELPPRDFKTDGCTLWLDSFLNYSWRDKCIEHDIRYWVGGTEEDRLDADLKLRDDVNEILPGMGDVIYLGVRIGGRNLSPLIPWPWGWGYGWNNGSSTDTRYLLKNGILKP